MRRLAVLLPLLLAGCASETEPLEPVAPPDPAVPLLTHADSVAWRVVEASGGLAAWEALPALRFEFGVERDGQQRTYARHYWDKAGGRYRVEWPGGEDSTYVALFSAWPDSVRVFLNGTPVEGLEQQARRRTINDTYWLLAPLKLFDEGVTRTYVADSSTADADALLLTFENVGMTPGDRYWLFVDRATGRLARWTFVLEGDPTRTPRSYRWTAYQTLRGPGGPVTLSARKEAIGTPAATLTDHLGAPASADSSFFTDPRPRL